MITAKNEEQINNALANDFTTPGATKLSVGESVGIGYGLQIYLKGKLVLTIGGGGGGGCISSSEEGYECGGGGGASIFLPDSNIKARVGGGHGVQAGYETEHNPTLFIRQLKRLQDLIANDSNVNGIAIMGGGGGGSGITTNDNTSSGRGYGFGFEIGSIEGINLAKKMMSRRTNEASRVDNRNPLNLPEHLLNEEWAIQVAEYI